MLSGLTRRARLPAAGRQATRRSPAPGLSARAGAEPEAAGPAAQAAPFFDRLVFSKIKARLGGRVTLILSGGAPLAPHVEEFLKARAPPGAAAATRLSAHAGPAFASPGKLLKVRTSCGVKCGPHTVRSAAVKTR